MFLLSPSSIPPLFTSGLMLQCESTGLCSAIEEEIAFKSYVSAAEGAKFKYALDIDGNGWSSRFHRLMTSGSAVLKMTIFPEWHSDWLSES